MGAEGSKNRRYRDGAGEEVFEESGQFNERQVGQLLEEQKIFYEQKMARLQQNQRQTQRPQSVAASSSYEQATPQPPGASVYARSQSVAASSSGQVNSQLSGAPVYTGQQYVAAAGTSVQANIQTYVAPMYPRLQSVATGSSAPLTPTYVGPVYPSLQPSYVATSGTTPMPVMISSPTAPPMESVAVDRPRAPYNFTQNDLQQRMTNNPAPIVQQPSHLAAATRPPMQSPAATSRPPVLSPIGNQSQPGTPNSSEYVFVNSNGEPERPRSAASQPRDRSASRPRQKKNQQEDDEIKCPTCRRTYGLTIYNCPNGHSSCKDCKQNNRACGKCYMQLTTTRNITLEAYLAERQAHCPHSDEGCCLYLKLADMEAHIKECPFREMSCPLNNIVGECSWKGKLSEIESHFDAFHPMQREGNVDTEMYVTLTSDSLSLMNTHIARLVIIGTFSFMFHLRVSKLNQMVYATVGMLGTAFSASKWTYEVHFYNKRQPRRKFQHTDACHSANSNLNEIFNEGKCAAIPVSYASTFVNENKLMFKFYIKKDFNEKAFKNNRGRGRSRR